MSIIPRFLPAHAGYHYEVIWNYNRHKFAGFNEAKEFLLTELWWLADELESEETMEAWTKVLTWDYDGHFPMTVEAGEPKRVYAILRIDREVHRP